VVSERTAALRAEPSPDPGLAASQPVKPPVAVGNRALARAAGSLPALAGRGLRADSAVLARAAVRRRALMRATKVQTSQGEFSVDNYNEFDSDSGNDTNKRCGVDIKITFKSPESLTSNKIGFVQVMKCVDGDGKPLLFANEKPRATDAKSGDAGWTVDRLKDRKWGYYGMDNDGTAAGNMGLGSRTSKDSATDAWMKDAVRLAREQGKTFSCTALTFAIDIEHGRYLGGVTWGYSVGTDGKVTKNTLAEADWTDAQRAAVAGWNAQSKLDDVTKRNDPDQQKLPEAPRAIGDFPVDPNAASMVG
jgi:hypothetical protein